MVQGRLWCVAISMLDLHQLFYNLGIVLFDPHHPSSSSSHHGLILAISWHVWQSYGGVGPLLWLREDCDVLPYPCWTYTKCFTTSISTPVAMIVATPSSTTLVLATTAAMTISTTLATSVAISVSTANVLRYLHWTYNKCFTTRGWYHLTRITLNTTLLAVAMDWD